VKAPLAFCKDGLWGFVTLDGTVLLEPQFEDATSFSKGMAAVKKDGKWGYIDKTGEFLIPPTFEEAGPLSPSGSAFVKNHAGYSLMKLSRYARSEK
ncbi:MAG: WG repeat-containing protein, partial [Clostridia bacterium]|nr:WG repeat-containing protein [Clostridia bacterium]